MLSQKSRLESQISGLEARNNVIRAQNERLCDQVASLRTVVDSLGQDLRAAQRTLQGHGSSPNEANAFSQHEFRAVRGVRSGRKQVNGVSYNRQIARPNYIVICGKSLMEVPSSDAQPYNQRS